MMPTCAYKRCHKVAEKQLGKIYTPDSDMPNGIWDETVYVCGKHYIKLLRTLGMQTTEALTKDREKK